MTFSATLESRVFRIWRYAAPRDWKVSYAEIEAATGLSHSDISHTISTKGWGGRIGRGYAHNMRMANLARSAARDIDEVALDHLITLPLSIAQQSAFPD